MMQLIHDVAPGATQAFHTASFGRASFAQGIRALAAAPVNADVIVDDVGYFTEPFFQNGIVAQAVDAVVANGVAYFSAAGNDARQSYASAFRNSGVNRPNGGPLHDFNPGPGVDIRQAVTIPARSGVGIFLQWDQPFFSVSGPPGSRSDVDIALVNNSGAALAFSVDENI
jgi:hypothetical protein